MKAVYSTQISEKVVAHFCKKNEWHAGCEMTSRNDKRAVSLVHEKTLSLYIHERRAEER